MVVDFWWRCLFKKLDMFSIQMLNYLHSHVHHWALLIGGRLESSLLLFLSLLSGFRNVYWRITVGDRK